MGKITHTYSEQERLKRPFRAYEGDEPYVFVCYAHDDKAFVYPEITRLRDSGFNIWYDEGIAPGSEWSDTLANHIKGCAAFLYFVTPRSVATEHCRRELNFALEQPCGMFAVHLEPTELPTGLQLTLSNRQAILKYDEPQAVYEAKLVSAIRDVEHHERQEVPASTLMLEGTRRVSRGVEAHEPDAPIPEPAIAVRPFVNMSNDPEQEYFSDGISEDVLNALAKSTGLAVRPRSSSFSLRGEAHDIRTIGRRLNVTHVLDGSVRRSGNRIRVTVQLSEVNTDTAIWSERYDRDLTDIFEVQDEIAGAISNAVNAEFGGTSTREFVSSAAYTTFLRGRHYRQRGDFEAAEEWLKTAVELHPRNADAWYELAAIQIGRHGLGLVAKDARLEYLNKVLAIDPAHPSALADRVYQETHLLQHDYQRAINELVRLIRTHPNDEAPLAWLSMVLLALGRDELVVRLSSRLVELSPLSYGRGNLMMVALLSNDLEKAKSALATFIQTGGVNPYYAIQVAAAQRDPDKLEAIEGDAHCRAIARTHAMYLRGEFDALRQAMQSAPDLAGYQQFYNKWIPSLWQRDLDSAFEHYRAALAAGEPIATQWVRGLIGDRVLFAEFYADPRYQQMLEEFGLDAESTSKIVVPELPF